MHPAPRNSRTSHLERPSVSLFDGKWKRQRVLTGTVESPACCDVKHGAVDGEQNPPSIFSTEFFERAWGIRREEYRRRVRAGHPRVPSFELCRGSARGGGGGDDYALEEVENVKEQGSIDRV